MQHRTLEAVPTLADTNGQGPSPEIQSAQSGAEILDDLRALIHKFCVLPSPEAEIAATLWPPATHALPALPCAPRLAITSPTMRAGKSRLLEIISGVCHKPLKTSSATAAAIYRSIDGLHPPTLVMDEADTIYGSNRPSERAEDLRCLFNSGFQRGWPVKRCERRRGQIVVEEFPTFAMAAIAGIGKLPDTITDRAVNIHMRKRKASESVSQFRERQDRETLDKMRDRLQAWLSQPSARDTLQKAQPDMAPLKDRAADTWEPLIMIADLAGGEWPDLARDAAKKLVADAEDDDQETLSVQLLADVRDVFADFDKENGVTDFLSSLVLISSLKAIEDSPWNEHPELNVHRMSRLLRDFQIRPHPDKTGNVRGYARSLFVDVWDRYLPTPRT